IKMKKKPIRLGISGALGRMGKTLIKEITKEKNVILNTAIVRKKNIFVQKDIGEIINIGAIGIKISTSLEEEIDNFDVLIDFSTPNNTMENLNICAKYKKNIVIGTTGFNQIEKNNIQSISNKIGIILSTNFSIGINIILKLLEITTHAISNDTDIEIIESHHRNKIDAPSGTALTLGETIAKTMKWNLDSNSLYRKKGLIGKREKQKIGFSMIRAGDIVGEHTVIFANTGERLEISHKASNRIPFSQGAIQAAIWLYTKKTGLFNMQDVLNI
ncbi:MAG TPA: 4-hydroxy-tetrahydrodipicolinate reductase, partial [Buchnera sp. (in: enterobacteria)]|nr:4-hydroxy-tetrahydrodipicolinate reductase [Buchnera sp. (in: enterobacteria)]